MRIDPIRFGNQIESQISIEPFPWLTEPIDNLTAHRLIERPKVIFDESETAFQGGQWFKATTMGMCLGLNFENRIGFDGGGTDTFDKFSRLIVRGQPCPIQTLEKVDGPPASKPKPQDKE